MAYTFNQLLHLVSLASQMLIGSDVLTIQGRSVNGFYVFLGPNIVSWSSRKQKLVARSNTESWFKALAHTAAEVTWLQALLKDLQVPNSSCPVIWCDNIRVACITAKLVTHARTKQMEVDVHFVRDKVPQKELDIWYVPTKDQVADILTKPLSISQFNILKVELNVKVSPFHLRWHVWQNVAVTKLVSELIEFSFNSSTVSWG